MSNEIPPRIKEVLGAAARGLGIPNALEAGALWRRWAEIAGPEMAAHAEPTSLRGGILKVRVDSPVWATEIGYLADDVKARANEILGGEIVSEVRVWAGGGPIKARAARAEVPQGRSERPSKRDRPAPTDADPESAFRRAFSAWKRRESEAAEPAKQPRKPW